MSLTPLRGARVLLGVSGGIAAYKAVEVCRRLFDAGAHVVPVLTEDALRFVGAVTFSAVASEPAHTSLWDDALPSPHTTLGRSADLVIVAPATTRTIGRYVAGISEDLLTATLLATAAPVLVCPAMHTEMWEHPATQDNIATLRRRGVHILDPADGALASGDVGRGRMREPIEIVDAAAGLLGRRRDLAGLRIVVSAGGNSRTDRSGPVHRQSVVGQAGICHRRCCRQPRGFGDHRVDRGSARSRRVRRRQGGNGSGNARCNGRRRQ